MAQQVKLFDAKVIFDIIELSHEQLRRPEIRVAFLFPEARTLPTAYLVIHDDRNTMVLVDQTDGKDIAVWSAGTAMETNERCLGARQVAPELIVCLALETILRIFEGYLALLGWLGVVSLLAWWLYDLLFHVGRHGRYCWSVRQGMNIGCYGSK